MSKSGNRVGKSSKLSLSNRRQERQSEQQQMDIRSMMLQKDFKTAAEKSSIATNTTFIKPMLTNENHNSDTQSNSDSGNDSNSICTSSNRIREKTSIDGNDVDDKWGNNDEPLVFDHEENEEDDNFDDDQNYSVTDKSGSMSADSNTAEKLTKNESYPNGSSKAPSSMKFQKRDRSNVLLESASESDFFENRSKGDSRCDHQDKKNHSNEVEMQLTLPDFSSSSDDSSCGSCHQSLSDDDGDKDMDMLAWSQAKRRRRKSERDKQPSQRRVLQGDTDDETGTDTDNDNAVFYFPSPEKRALRKRRQLLSEDDSDNDNDCDNDDKVDRTKTALNDEYDSSDCSREMEDMRLAVKQSRESYHRKEQQQWQQLELGVRNSVVNTVATRKFGQYGDAGRTNDERNDVVNLWQVVLMIYLHRLDCDKKTHTKANFLRILLKQKQQHRPLPIAMDCVE